MTAYTYKFHLIVPAADCKGVNAWIKDSIDPSGSDWLTPNLPAPDGGTPDKNHTFTHAQACFHATKGQAEKWAAMLEKFTPLLSLEGFTGKPRPAQKLDLAAYEPALKVSKGYALAMAFNDQGETPAATTAPLPDKPAAAEPATLTERLP